MTLTQTLRGVLALCPCSSLHVDSSHPVALQFFFFFDVQVCFIVCDKNNRQKVISIFEQFYKLLLGEMKTNRYPSTKAGKETNGEILRNCFSSPPLAKSWSASQSSSASCWAVCVWGMGPQEFLKFFHCPCSFEVFIFMPCFQVQDHIFCSML